MGAFELLKFPMKGLSKDFTTLARGNESLVNVLQVIKVNQSIVIAFKLSPFIMFIGSDNRFIKPFLKLFHQVIFME